MNPANDLANDLANDPIKDPTKDPANDSLVTTWIMSMSMVWRGAAFSGSITSYFRTEEVFSRVGEMSFRKRNLKVQLHKEIGTWNCLVWICGQLSTWKCNKKTRIQILSQHK